MLNLKSSFTGLSVDNLQQAREFYTQTLGLALNSDAMGLQLNLPGGDELFI